MQSTRVITSLAGSGRFLDLDLQHRDPDTGRVIQTPVRVESSKVGVVIVDPWNFHWCMTACARFATMAPRMNRALECARRSACR